MQLHDTRPTMNHSPSLFPSSLFSLFLPFPPFSFYIKSIESKTKKRIRGVGGDFRRWKKEKGEGGGDEEEVKRKRKKPKSQRAKEQEGGLKRKKRKERRIKE